MARAEADPPDGMSIPDELARLDRRAADIARSPATIEARTKKRHPREQAEHESRCRRGSLLVAANDVEQATNDKRQAEPMLGKLGAVPEELGNVQTLSADTLYCALPPWRRRRTTRRRSRRWGNA